MAQEKADSGATIAIFLGSASWVVIPPQCEWRDVRSPVLVLIVPRVLRECWDDGLSLSLTKPGVSDESATLPIYIFRKMTSTERRVTPRRFMKTAAD
jgi:hypothetical protein